MPTIIPKFVEAELERLHNVLMNATGLGWQDRRKWAQDRIEAIHKAWFESPPNKQPSDEEVVMQIERPAYTAEHIAAALDIANDLRLKDYHTKTNDEVKCDETKTND